MENGMKRSRAAIILDVGATNVGAVAVDETGNILAQKFSLTGHSPIRILNTD